MKKKLLFVMCFITQMQALKLDRVILATDANPNYIEFWPIVARAWKEIIGIKPTLALIATEDTFIDESLGDVIRFKPIEGISTAFQAQVIRLLLPVLYPEDGCIPSDIDMIPLNRSYFIDSVQDCPDDSFVVYRDKAYASDAPAYPLCYVAARGQTFKDVFKIETFEDIRSIIKAWHNLGYGWFTDEMLLFECLNAWQDKDSRWIKLGHIVERRVDRSQWLFDQELVRSGYYIDAHCLRPYSLYKDIIDPLMMN